MSFLYKVRTRNVQTSEFSGFEDDEILPSRITANTVEKPSSSKKSDAVTLESS